MDTKLQLVPNPRDGRHLETTEGDHGGAIPFVVLPPRARARGRAARRRRVRPEQPEPGTRTDQRSDEAPGRLAQLTQDERGAVTAEYAIVIMAAVAFAGLLVAILRSAEIRAMLVQLVEDALGAAG